MNARNPAGRPPTLPLDRGTVWVFAQELDRPAQPLEFFAAVLSTDERQRAERYCRALDGQRFTVARGMLRHTLGSILRVPPADLQFSYSQHGKPALSTAANQYASLQFNLAHSDHLAMLAVAAEDAVGIDVEKIRPVKLRDGIVAKHCSLLERKSFQEIPDEQRTEAFFRIWTRKEAVVKAIGTGLSLPLTSFDVSLSASRDSALLAMRHPEYRAGAWSLWPLPAPPGFCAALAIARAGPVQLCYDQSFGCESLRRQAE